MMRVVIVLGALVLFLFGIAFQVRLAEAAQGLVLPAVGIVGAVAAAFACAGGRAERLLKSRHGAVIAWGACAAVLLLLLVFGRRYRGGLYLPGLINPSEFVKLGAVVFAAARLACDEARPKPMLFIGYGSIVALAAAVGDFGLAAQLALTFAAILFVVSWAWGLGAIAAIVAAFALAAAFPVGHLAVRFAVWRDPLADATGAGWQTLQGLVAIVRGGSFGSGFGLGHADYVPIVSSDFVYAALAEDLGIVGCAVLLSIWAAVVVAAFRSAARSHDAGRTGSALLSCGLAAAICVQITLNVAGVLNALPMTGIPLPLISHGGTSLVATLAMCGILAGLAGTGKPEEELVVPEKKKRSIRNNGNGNRRRDAVRRGTRNPVDA